MTAKPQEALPEAPTTTEASGELGSLLRAPLLRTQAASAAVVLGRISAVGPDGAISVEIPGATGARSARLAAPLSRSDLLAAVEDGRPAVLVFENADPALPIIVGLMQPAASDSAMPAPIGSSERGNLLERDPAPAQIVQADVDGKRVRIVAEDEIVLECGSASITLRRNGRVVVRGTYVETYSEGTNRIKGGQVRIN